MLISRDGGAIETGMTEVAVMPIQCDAERGTHPTSGNDADREPRRAESVRAVQGGPHRNHESTSLNVESSFVPVLQCGYRTVNEA